MKHCPLLWLVCVCLGNLTAGKPSSALANQVRIAAAQPQRRSVDWHIREAKDVLARVDKSLGELEVLIDKAAAQKCDVIAFPEDTLGLGLWEADNHELARAVLPEAVQRMCSRFGAAAAKHGLYVLCCNHHIESDGAIYNTAFLIGRDGKEIGRYHKTCPTIHEGACKPGTELPVFHTPDLGDVGMLICYDLVFPETARCLALKGADVIFHLTLGGAAIGDDDISLGAFRTRAVENFVYLVVAQRGSGSMIISPQGKILVEAKSPDSLAIAEIDPFSGREGGDAYNTQKDMRARLFRERNPGAFGILTETNPPALAKVPLKLTREEATRISNRVVTKGEEEFRAARELAEQHEIHAAVREFTRLRSEYPDSWIDFESARWLNKLEPEAGQPKSEGLAATDRLALVWLRDLDKAKAQAKAEGKSILLFFHGSGWCPPCVQMERQVIQSAEFVQYARRALVLVDADFPEGRKQTEEQTRANLALKAKFNLSPEWGEGFPTIVLLNEAGETVFQETGYFGGGPAEVLPKLQRHTAQASGGLNPAGFRNLTLEEFSRMVEDKANVILDVRTATEFEAGHLARALNLDATAADFESKASGLDKSKVYLVHCASGVRSLKACEILGRLGFTNLYNFPGGFRAWGKAGKSVERRS